MRTARGIPVAADGITPSPIVELSERGATTARTPAGRHVTGRLHADGRGRIDGREQGVGRRDRSTDASGFVVSDESAASEFVSDSVCATRAGSSCPTTTDRCRCGSSRLGLWRECGAHVLGPVDPPWAVCVPVSRSRSVPPRHRAR
jgi:hypothetical protein